MFSWAADEAYWLNKIKTKATRLADTLRGLYLSRDAEEALYDLIGTVDDDNVRQTRIPADAGYPHGPDVDF